jgi:choline dehydrogenase-like flavoprotein
MPSADVIVVGAGPAGTAAAVTLAEAGRDVVVVDKARFPRDKICGDGLTTGALRLLERLGLEPGAVPSWQTVDDVVVRGPSGHEVTFPLPRGRGTYAAVARRHDLDAALVERARSAGAKVLDGHACTGVSARPDDVTAAFSNLVAMQVGAFVAVRSARWTDHHSGMLQGLIVWALVFTLAAAALGLGVGGLLAGGASAEQAGRAAVDAAQAATGAPTGPDRLSPAEADAVQDVAALTAWWAFVTMALGAVGAVAGGKLGSEHPDWRERERADRPVTMADRL